MDPLPKVVGGLDKVPVEAAVGARLVAAEDLGNSVRTVEVTRSCVSLGLEACMACRFSAFAMIAALACKCCRSVSLAARLASASIAKIERWASVRSS